MPTVYSSTTVLYYYRAILLPCNTTTVLQCYSMDLSPLSTLNPLELSFRGEKGHQKEAIPPESPWMPDVVAVEPNQQNECVGVVDAT